MLVDPLLSDGDATLVADAGHGAPPGDPREPGTGHATASAPK
jgi:hypothetical protein